MLNMEYPLSATPLKYACSTMSVDTLSRSCGSRNNRIRTIRLVKRINGHMTLNSRQTPSLGFSIRGGHEHGTGFFVSNVEAGSEAHAHGLKVGDQIIRINGFAIEDAIHKEVLQLISNLTHLTLKVRGVGIIPVKEKKSDSLSWQIVSDEISSSRSSPQFGDKNRDVRINILVAARSKLGCGICKGPDWKPGIFVQFTKEGGIAREAGLRPGDQILQCNNVDFSDIAFGEAVNLMKSSRQLELIVRKAAASELFPGESSGYNSSASSVTEDQSPSWADPKRLSIVKEEIQDLDERLSHNRLLSNVKKWKMEDWEEEQQENKLFKPTIINLSENGTTIKNNGREYQNTKHQPNEPASTISSKESQTIVDVHKNDLDLCRDKMKLTKSPSVSSFSSLASSSLSSALSMEIEKRLKKQAGKEAAINIDEQIEKKKALKTVRSDPQHQHTMLMNEFKQAHQKMFKSAEAEVRDTNSDKDCTNEHEDHGNLSEKLSSSWQDRVKCEEANESDRQVKSIAPPPPPPPPPPSKLGVDPKMSPAPPSPVQMPNLNSISTLRNIKAKPKAPPVPVKHSVLSFHQPPPCPTPDYDTLSIASSSSSIKPTHTTESVEIESLDSFKLNNLPNYKPRSPNTYFQKTALCKQASDSSSVSMRSNNDRLRTPLSSQLSNISLSSFKSESPNINSPSNERPKSLITPIQSSTVSQFRSERPKSVNVVVGEYAAVRTQPKRLDFLKNEVEKFNGVTDELTQTLNRSNLRKRTESMDDLLNIQQIKPQSNGSVRISLNSSLSKDFTKSTSDLTEDYDRFLFKRPGSNKIMINVNQDKTFNLTSKNSFG